MIATLRGKLAIKSASGIVVETGGVGYAVSVPVNMLSELPHEGSEVFLHIHTHVREDALNLYGFSSLGEKRVFTTLLGITGIGPKLALNVLSGMPYEEFTRAVEAEDVDALCRIPGLGKKTANRVVLELRGKLPKDGMASVDTMMSDALSALVNLGYKKPEAGDAIERARKAGHMTIEDILRESLRSLTSEQVRG